MKLLLLGSLLVVSCAAPQAKQSPPPAAPAAIPQTVAPIDMPARAASTDPVQAAAESAARLNPFGVPADLDDGADYFPAGPKDAAIATPQSVLNAPVGKRPAHHEEVARLWHEWARTSPRVRLEVTGRTHEGRELLAGVVTSERNMARLDEILAGVRRLSDPRGLADADAQAIIANSPAVAWMAYSIHGDEMSGVDALHTWYLLLGSDSSASSVWPRS